ncbi:MAG: transposase, partial [Pyramidobacter sp.]|nr:transposase [Pyramidobacter sp.]
MSTKRSYSPEEKQSAVETFLQSKMSQQELAERYGTGNATIRNWIRLYQTFGMEGLSQQKQTTRYSPEL